MLILVLLIVLVEIILPPVFLAFMRVIAFTILILIINRLSLTTR